MNLDLINVESGAESADALQPRATPWVWESIGAPCKGAGILRPFRAERVLGYVPGALPRAGMLRAVGASPPESSRGEKYWYEAIYEPASSHELLFAPVRNARHD